jgi:hypothetical protein
MDRKKLSRDAKREEEVTVCLRPVVFCPALAAQAKK